jgi:V/A-type H+-transporting ATPase subunit I
MFVLGAEVTWATPWPYLLICGSTLAILFQSPCKNIFKMVGLGLANFPFSFLSSFSDIISYVRLMAVGLAGTVLAVSFNDLALSLGHWYLTLPVMICGHALNIGLALIALFSHGVRLNMLEFSNNLGMQWTGYLYKPFARRMAQEK